MDFRGVRPAYVLHIVRTWAYSLLPLSRTNLRYTQPLLFKPGMVKAISFKIRWSVNNIKSTGYPLRQNSPFHSQRAFNPGGCS